MSDTAAWQRLILFQPRPEFPLPAEWAGRDWLPLGEMRPLLQAVSPVRDLSDIWRWVAEPLPAAAVEAALAAVGSIEALPPAAGADPATRPLGLEIDGHLFQAAL